MYILKVYLHESNIIWTFENRWERLTNSCVVDFLLIFHDTYLEMIIWSSIDVRELTGNILKSDS